MTTKPKKKSKRIPKKPSKPPQISPEMVQKKALRPLIRDLRGFQPLIQAFGYSKLARKVGIAPATAEYMSKWFPAKGGSIAIWAQIVYELSGGEFRLAVIHKDDFERRQKKPKFATVGAILKDQNTWEDEDEPENEDDDEEYEDDDES